MDGDVAVIFCGTTRFGVLTERVEMVRDWLSRGDLVRVWLEKYSDNEHVVFLAFYRDEEKRLAYRECTTSIKLVRCRNQEAQLNMIGLDPGDKLSFEEDVDSDGNDIVWIDCGGVIGALPKKYAERYLSEGAAAVFVDYIDANSEDKTIPFVKIYW